MANRKVLLSIFVNIVFKLLQIQFESWQHVLGDWPPDEGCVNYVIVQLTLQRSVRLFVYVSLLAYSRHQLMTREIYMDITLIRGN